MNVLGDEKKKQVVALGGLGWSVRRIHARVGVDRKTIKRYLKAAGVAVRAPGGSPSQWPPSNAATSEEVSTDSGTPNAATNEGVSTDCASRQWPVKPSRAPAASACEPYRDVIEEALGRGRNAVSIYQELVDDYGFGAKYASVKRFVRALRGDVTPEARVVITTAPGEESQVDYGEGPMVRHPETGKYKRTRLFVLTLGYSRKSVRLLTWKSSARIWAELHERAFRRLGGSTKVAVLDNLREGVLTPDVYDATLNPLYRDVLAHYGVVAMPCRVRDPDRKGKVESGVGHAQKTPLRGQRFEHIDAAQAHLDRWEANWADTRIHGTTKRQVAVMFAEEKPYLIPLPVEPFRHYDFGDRTVHLDGCIEVEAAYYGAPPGWIGRTLHAQWDGIWVRLVEPTTGKLLREHLRQERGRHRIAEEDRPSRTPDTTEGLLRRARSAGRHIGNVCAEIHRRDGEPGVRRILGVLNLTKKHGAPTVDDAAKAALELGAPTYRFLRRYLERRTPAPLTLKQVDPLIRQLTHYRDLIQRRTE
jgi:transposase